ncbi:unnamed protein product [Coffea canephora]|uniref:Uncharacterized protein n=1 Tax=Coffea canephora TaxID=49390 RepID=A0A068TRR0_COFCA|nr:unnamed protein product [Coffea canephora]
MVRKLNFLNKFSLTFPAISFKLSSVRSIILTLLLSLVISFKLPNKFTIESVVLLVNSFTYST